MAEQFEQALTGAATDVAQFEEEAPSLLKRIQHYLHANPTAIPLIILVIGLIAFSLLVGRKFFHPFNLSLIVSQVMLIGFLGAAQTLIVLTAGIDLSVGTIMILSSVVMGKLAVIVGVPAPLALIIGILAGIVCGAINGALVVYWRLPPFIVTLGTWSIFLAINYWYSNLESIRSQDIDAVAPLLKFLGTPIRALGFVIPFGVILMLGLFALLWYVLNRTAFGRHIYATGDDPDAARLAGIQVDHVLLKVYTIAGAICGLAGWAIIGRIGAVSPQSGIDANLDSITAVVIGGVSLFGGRGSIVGALIGALIVGVFRNGLKLYGIDVQGQLLMVGVLIIAAVALDQWLRRVAQ